MMRTLLVLSLFGGTALVLGCEEKKETPPPAPTPTPAPTPPPAPTPTTTPPPAAGATGQIKGSVTFTGKAPEMAMIKRDADPFCAKTKMKAEDVMVNGNGTLKNVVVRLVNVTGTFEAPKEPAQVVQDACMYRPRVQGVVAGQTVLVKNGDQTLHNVHTYKGMTTLANKAQVPASAPIEMKFTDAGSVIKFKCDVHPWMAGYVSVTNHPFFAVTGDDGSFEIKNVPAGSYDIEAWHEKFGTKTAKVTVAAGPAAEVKLAFDGSEGAPAK